MLTCLVVDDERAAINVLRSYIERTPFLKLEGSTSDPMEALVFLQAKPIDLIFLDIEMPQLSGLELMKIIHKRTKVIFTTAYATHAVAAFEQEAIDYLLKPYSFERFLRAAQKALNTVGFTAPQWKPPVSIATEEEYIFVKTENKGKMIKVNFNELLYVEGLKNYVSLYTKEERIITLLNMKDLEERLPTKSFMRVHKSYLVALSQIRAVDGNQIFLKDVKAHLILGETYRTSFFRALDCHLISAKK
jgi:DNA-binding LytR/AlgR family response regulator